MQDEPTPAEILASVAAFLREALLPLLPSHAAFQARVAANAVDLVRRQIELAPATDAAERERLRRLLGHDGSLEALNRELSHRIASGAIGPETPELLEHLWQTTLAKLAVDQPGYASYRRAREER